MLTLPYVETTKYPIDHLPIDLDPNPRDGEHGAQAI